MKHTPGPWEVQTYKEPYNKHQLTYHIVSKDSLIVAKCGTGDFEIPSNARLIAAAPDLLEALESIVGGSTQRVSAELQTKAQAAIAKARGEK